MSSSQVIFDYGFTDYFRKERGESDNDGVSNWTLYSLPEKHVCTQTNLEVNPFPVHPNHLHHVIYNSKIKWKRIIRKIQIDWSLNSVTSAQLQLQIFENGRLNTNWFLFVVPQFSKPSNLEKILPLPNVIQIKTNSMFWQISTPNNLTLSFPGLFQLILSSVGKLKCHAFWKITRVDIKRNFVALDQLHVTLIPWFMFTTN